jgi:hypothetical protein
VLFPSWSSWLVGLDMDFKADFERVTIIAGLALIVASLLLLFGQLSGGSLDDSD